jgi:hypothetical protein
MFVHSLVVMSYTKLIKSTFLQFIKIVQYVLRSVRTQGIWETIPSIHFDDLKHNLCPVTDISVDL